MTNRQSIKVFPEAPAEVRCFQNKYINREISVFALLFFCEAE